MNGSLGYEPYSEYKPSGIDWLGDVPEHWVVRRLKTLCGLKSGDGITAESIEPSGEYPVYGGNGLRGYTSAYTHHGDFVLIGRQGALCGNIHIARSKFWASEHAVVATLDAPHIVEWFAAILEAMNLNQYSIAAAQPGLSVERVLNLSLPVPPLAEQTAVVRYLDHADERIRHAISAKERLIELLIEQRQAVIHRAVTRGLNPDAPLKDSSVEWLGDVPEHWDVRRMRFLVNISTGSKDTINRVDDGKYPFFVRSQTVERINTWSFDGEAVLTAGDGVGVGRVFHYVNGKFDYHQRVYKFSDFRNVLGRFFYHYLATTLPLEVRQGTAKSTVDSLRLPMLQNLPVVVAPITEQLSVVHYLDKVTADIDTAINKAQRQIDLLREYRTRLIADVVTGQVDVRGAAGDEVELPAS